MSRQVYKTEEGRQASISLYEEQLRLLDTPYSDIYIDTDFGKTHLIETGKTTGKPLLVFHGGNTTTAYNLHLFRFLLEEFHIYAVDTIGHPGKSAEKILPANSLSYGQWASQVVNRLGFTEMSVLGCSYGGGIVGKLIEVSPEKIERAVLVVPSGIKNDVSVSILTMLFNLFAYRLTKNESYLIKTALYLRATSDRSSLDEHILAVLKDSFDHVKMRTGMPSNISKKGASRYNAPILVMAAEKDCFFPAKKVLPRAKEIFEHCKTYELTARGHLSALTTEEQEIIIDFLRG